VRKISYRRRIGKRKLKISFEHICALEEIESRFKEAKIRWVVIGSTSLAFHDIGIIPDDIDILTDKEGALKTNKILKKYMVKKVKWRKTNQYKSYFGEFKMHLLKVEIMGELSMRTKDGWKSLMRRLDEPVYEYIDGIPIPISRLEDHLELCQNSIVQKDQERAKLIEAEINKRIEEANRGWGIN